MLQRIVRETNQNTLREALAGGGPPITLATPTFISPAFRERRVLPCTKLRNGTCPVAKLGAIDCDKRKKIGCPFLVQGNIDLNRLRAFAANPDLVWVWMGRNLYSPAGIQNGR